MTFKRLRPLKFANNEIHIGSFSATTACEIAPMSFAISTALGEAYITKDSEIVYKYCYKIEEDEVKTLQEFENIAALEPDCDWRFVHTTPLHGETFQRQGDRLWLCVESNMGFA